jgi:hypothetical protein
MVTSSNLRSIDALSSFGEHHIRSATKSVAEGASKVFNLGRVAVTLSGSVQHGRSIVEALKTSLTLYPDVPSAIRSALNSNAPFDNNDGQLLFAFCDG